jgi:ubiquinone/menaquinone biosynthesis C-methylase UbiE
MLTSLAGNVIQSTEETPWYFREEITNNYESWYEGKYKKADLQEKITLIEMIKWIGEIHSLLEVGCGTAHFTRWFEENRLDSCGLDFSPFMLKEAKSLWRNGKLVLGISDFLPIKDKAVDLVAFITCIEYMPDPVAVIKEARRIAREGLVMGLMNSWSIPTLRRKIQVIFGKNPFYSNARFYSLYKIRSIIKMALQDEKYSLRQISTAFPRPLLIERSRVPFGAFLCVGVRFED